MNRVFRTMMMTLLTVAFFGAGFTTAWSQTGPIGGASVSAAAITEANKVHLVVTGFTKVNGDDIGPDCRADLTAVQAMFSSTFQGSWRNRLEIHPLYGDAWSPDKIRQYLQDMTLGANDVVVFYHAGHGSIQDPSRPVDTHSLLVNGGILQRGELQRLLVTRHCRGVIILTDCCSSVPQLAGNRSINIGAEPRLNRETVRNLFLRLKGMVDITAAEVGHTAGNTYLDNFAGARGAFTVAFLKVACDTHVYSHWQDFFPALRQMTQTASGGRHRAQAFTIREESGANPDQTVPASSLPTTGPLR